MASTSLPARAHRSRAAPFPLVNAILVSMGKFNHILDINYAGRLAVVQPSVANLAISRAVEDRVFCYAPDPSSQIACSIGGNVAAFHQPAGRIRSSAARESPSIQVNLIPL